MIILWLDDAFDSKKNNAPELETYNGLKKLLDEEYDKSVDLRKCSNGEQFLDEMKQHDKSVVVAILDVEGLDTSDAVFLQESTNQKAFSKALRMCQERHIPYGIYSGNISEGKTADNPSFKAFTEDAGFRVDKGFFGDDDDEDTPDEYKLFNELKRKRYIEDFPWKDFEYVIDLIRLEHIKFKNTDEENAFFESIKSYKEETYDLSKLNTCRQIMEYIFTHMFQYFSPLNNYNILKANGVVNNNSVIKYLANGCHSRNVNGRREKDPENPLFPFEVCPQVIKDLLPFVWNVVNDESHYEDELKEYFKDGMKDIKKQYARTVYDSFFLVLRWYSIFMKKELYRELL